MRLLYNFAGEVSGSIHSVCQAFKRHILHPKTKLLKIICLSFHGEAELRFTESDGVPFISLSSLLLKCPSELNRRIYT